MLCRPHADMRAQRGFVAAKHAIKHIRPARRYADAHVRHDTPHRHERRWHDSDTRASSSNEEPKALRRGSGAAACAKHTDTPHASILSRSSTNTASGSDASRRMRCGKMMSCHDALQR
ncbi:hypothetical protein AVEN_105710-1 [Araneus ventricosus]|uniref:Uncharacterized protein n=1 Tax=Araneus ventricosus TaxID=182803 RepID=A0A4Y2W809_ARAVE|nr:hypothetical protein AVEN_105710-1 [Araneus ventricosus]